MGAALTYSQRSSRMVPTLYNTPSGRPLAGKVVADMITRSVKCPECDAPIRVGPAQRHCECVNCGDKYVVAMSDSQQPQLTRFEALIAQGLNGVPVQEAERRLNELDLAIAEAETIVETRHVQLDAAQEAYRARRVEVQKTIAPSQNWTYVTGLVAVVAWFLVWFVLEGTGWLLALGVGIAGLVLSWAFHSRWLAAESRAAQELSLVRKGIEAAEAELSEAYLQLDDRVLERELRQRELAGVRSSNE